MSSVRDRADAVGRSQYGWATRAQLLEEAGVSRSSIHRMVRSGRWTQPYPGIVDLGTHDPSWRRQVAGAVLAAGPGAWASHTTAARLHGFLDVDQPERIDVLVPRGRFPVLGALPLHTARSIGDDETTRVSKIPVTTAARTLLDLSASSSPEALERYLANLARRTPSVVAEVVRLTDRHRHTPGRRRLLLVVGRLPDDAAKLGSPLEVLGTQRLRQLGAPPFELQYRVRDVDGAVVKRVDVAWPALRTVVEFDGADFHDLAGARAHDLAVRARMRALGWHVEVVRRQDLDSPDFAAFVRRLAAVAG